MHEGNSTEVSVRIPARIEGGKCPWPECGQDLSFLFPKIESGEIDPPHHCPCCGNPVRDQIEVDILRCSACRTEIVDPSKEKYCRGCGRKLNYASAQQAAKAG